MALAHELGRADVLIDDKKGINACKAMGLQFATSLDVLLMLCRQDTIGKEKAYNALAQLEQHGWYNTALLEWAKGEIDAT